LERSWTARRIPLFSSPEHRVNEVTGDLVDAKELTELGLNFCLHSFLSDPSAPSILNAGKLSTPVGEDEMNGGGESASNKSLNSTKLVEGEVGLVVAKLEAPVPDAVLLAHHNDSGGRRRKLGDCHLQRLGPFYRGLKAQGRTLNHPHQPIVLAHKTTVKKKTARLSDGIFAQQ